MAAFYHDSSRKSVFAERARGFGPIGPEKCQVDLLEWSPGMNVSTSQTADVDKLCPHSLCSRAAQGLLLHLSR